MVLTLQAMKTNVVEDDDDVFDGFGYAIFHRYSVFFLVGLKLLFQSFFVQCHRPSH